MFSEEPRYCIFELLLHITFWLMTPRSFRFSFLFVFLYTYIHTIDILFYLLIAVVNITTDMITLDSHLI